MEEDLGRWHPGFDKSGMCDLRSTGRRSTLGMCSASIAAGVGGAIGSVRMLPPE